MRAMIKNKKRSLITILLGVVGLGLVFAFTALAPLVDNGANVVVKHAPHTVSPQAQALHDHLRVADLHADTLLWGRNPAKRQSRGQTDFVRLRQGGIALQVFGAVTFVPAGMNTEANTDDKDQLTALMIAQKWPTRTWTSRLGRALFQAERLQKLADQSGGDFVFARSSSALLLALSQREKNPDLLIGLLASEGAHPLEGKLSNADVMYDHGYRIMGLTHFFDNELGGSLHGVSKSGLTDFGRHAVRAIVNKGMIIDLAHASEQMVAEVLNINSAPMIISHTGIRSLCDHPRRNIPDTQLQAIADNGGLIGIGYWEMAVCDPSPAGIAQMIVHGVAQFGVDHIALGSDFDGGVTTQFDTSELAAITHELLARDMSAADIAKVMGENQIAFFVKNLRN